MLPSLAAAQVLHAKWVEQADERIEQVRKAPLRIILLDEAGDPVEQCEVRIEQLRHAFPFGVSITPELIKRAPVLDEMSKAPVWRAFNAVSLDAAAGWDSLEPEPGRWRFDEVDRLLDWSEQRGMSARWGAVLTADRGRMPKWASELDGEALQRAMERHLRKVLHRYGRRVSQFDLIADTLDHAKTLEALGPAAIRRLHHLAEATLQDLSPVAARGQIGLAFSDAFGGERLQNALRQITRLRESFVPLESVSIGVRLHGALVQAPIARTIDWLEGPGLPVMLTGVEIGGASPAAAAINLETTIRSVFSGGGVDGVWFAGLDASRLSDPAAALIDERGQPTQAGTLLDQLVRTAWWTDVSETTDELGNVNVRAFAGHYRLSAKLPGGAKAEMTVFLPANRAGRLIVLQPLKTDSTERGEPARGNVRTIVDPFGASGAP